MSTPHECWTDRLRRGAIDEATAIERTQARGLLEWVLPRISRAHARPWGRALLATCSTPMVVARLLSRCQADARLSPRKLQREQKAFFDALELSAEQRAFWSFRYQRGGAFRYSAFCRLLGREAELVIGSDTDRALAIAYAAAVRVAQCRWSYDRITSVFHRGYARGWAHRPPLALSKRRLRTRLRMLLPNHAGIRVLTEAEVLAVALATPSMLDVLGLLLEDIGWNRVGGSRPGWTSPATGIAAKLSRIGFRGSALDSIAKVLRREPKMVQRALVRDPRFLSIAPDRWIRIEDLDGWLQKVGPTDVDSLLALVRQEWGRSQHQAISRVLHLLRRSVPSLPWSPQLLRALVAHTPDLVYGRHALRAIKGRAQPRRPRVRSGPDAALQPRLEAAP